MPEPKIPVNDMRFEVGIEADRILDSQDVNTRARSTSTGSGLRDEPDPVEVERARVFRAAETLLAWIDANQKRVRAVLTVKPGLIDDRHRAFEIICCATHHDRQLTLLGARLATGYRRIENPCRLAARCQGNLASNGR